MAKSSEIVQLEQIHKGFETVNTDINKTVENYLRLVKTIETGSKAIGENVVSFEGLNKAQKQTQDNSKQIDSLGKQLAASEAKLKQLTDQRTESLIKNRIQIGENTKAIKDKIKADQAEEGSLVRMRQKLSELTSAYDKTGTRTKIAAKEINDLSREIGEAEAATNRHQRGVGGYADQLGNLSPALGGATSAAATFGKALWALVANPIGAIIAVIVGSLALLYKAFTSTDKGAVAMASTLKAIGNVMDILIDRAMSYYKMLWSLVTFNWEGVKKNGKDAFGGLGDAIMDAANAGKNFEEVMDDIKDRESASKITIAKLSKEYTDLYLASKNVNLSYSERLRLADEAMAKESQVNKLEVQFQKERTIANRDNLAALINDNKLSIESKQKLVEQWLQYDQEQLKSEEKKGGMFSEFVNKNEAAFQKLQEMYAETVEKENELNQKTIRLQSSRFNFIKQMNDEVIDSNKKVAAEKEIQQEEDEKDVQEKEKDKAKAVEDGLKKQEDLIVRGGTEKNAINEKLIKDEADLMDEALKDAMSREEKEFENWYDIEEKKKDKQKDDAKKKAELEKETAEKIRDLQFEIAAETVNGIFDIGSAKRDEELSALDKEREKKLDNDKLTAKQKDQINAEYDKKAAAIKTKQAKADKLQAMFNIALSTAMGAAKAVAESPLTGGMPFLAWVLALGALQLGVVAAKPIPKYKDGGIAKDGLGIFGEAGRELGFLKSGDVVMANKATYFEGSKFKGMEIKTNAETEKIMSMTGHGGFSGNTTTDDRILHGLKSVERAILNKPVAILDKDHKQIGYATSNSQTIYLNRLMRN
ncbi:MAG TPA: hypothetical protein DCS19_01345 [Flavobacterium sp.]|nr:hypothetical protein [Flavobacterium sp.]